MASSFLGKIYFNFLQLSVVLCVKFRLYRFAPFMLTCFLLLSLFKSYLSNHVGETWKTIFLALTIFPLYFLHWFLNLVVQQLSCKYMSWAWAPQLNFDWLWFSEMVSAIVKKMFSWRGVTTIHIFGYSKKYLVFS